MTLSGLHRHLLMALIGAMLGLAVCAGGARAAGFGEVLRFGEEHQQGSVGKPTEFGFLAGQERFGPEEQNYGIGVDPSEENAVFALDEPAAPKEHELKSEETFKTEHHVRIQKFKFNSTKKTYEASASVTLTVSSPEHEEEEDEEAEQFSNIAVDPKDGVLYVLSEEPRALEVLPDKEAGVASTLYAFKTSESGEKLVPAAGTKEIEGPDKEKQVGVLVGPQEFQAESTTPGKALLEPRGITVDPSTGEVIVLGHVDETGAETDEIMDDHFVLQRIKSTGAFGARYLDTSDYFIKKEAQTEEFPSSPVVSETTENSKPVFHVLVEFDGVTEVPYDFETGGEPKQLYTEPSSTKVKSILEDVRFLNESGGNLALSPEGQLYSGAPIRNEAVAETTGPLGIAVHASAPLVEGKGGSSGALLGWTGGQLPEVNKLDECVLQPGGREEPLYVAAGAGGDVFALAPEYLVQKSGSREQSYKELHTHMGIIELGPRESSSGCPTAKGTTITLSENGRRLEKPIVAAGKQVQIGTEIDQADALTAEWTIENLTEHKTTVEKPNPLEFGKEGGFEDLQDPQLSFTFTKCGNYKVSAKLHTDDLASEVVEPKALPSVSVEQVPLVTHQPESQSVTEGSPVEFLAEASGCPTPVVAWEVSTDGGAEYTEIAGATSDKLKLSTTTLAESGNKYRALFENEVAGQIEVATSEAATLTVTTKKAGGEAPNVTHSPESQTVTEPATAKFTAAASGSPTPTVQWEVSTNKGVSFSVDTTDRGTTTDTLEVEGTSQADNGHEYRAVFTNEFEGEKHEAKTSAATLTVSPLKAPEITQQPESQTVTEPATAKFTAAASGSPTPTVQWEVSTNKGVSFSVDTTDRGNTTDTLEVTATSQTDNAYEYRAAFKNTAGEVKTSPATLTVHEQANAAPTITSQPESQTVTEPATAQFTASASGTPEPSVQWEVRLFGESNFTPDTSDSGATTDTLKVDFATVADSGREYRAVFTNEFGHEKHEAKSNPAKLTVMEESQSSPSQNHGPSNLGGGSEGGVLANLQSLPPAPVPDATLASSALSVGPTGVVTLTVTCPSSETTCAGTVTLRTLTAVVASNPAAKASKKPKRAILTLASGSFSVAGGGRQAIKLHLSSAARALLAHSHTLRAKATIAAHDAAGAKHTQEQVVTLHLAKR